MGNKIQQLKDADGNNIYPIAYVNGGVKMDLLWTNPSPTSSFSAQTVSLDLSKYSLIMLYTKSRNDLDVYYFRSFQIDGKNSRTGDFLTGTNAFYARGVTVGPTGIIFDSGYYTSTQNDNYAIPYQIYGIKMSYVVPTTVHGLQYVEVE